MHEPVEGVEGCGDQAARQNQQWCPPGRVVKAHAADLMFVRTGLRSYQSSVLKAGWPPSD
jgi:hypothetical protein